VIMTLTSTPKVFVDPAGCNHAYKEFEMNARNTTWCSTGLR
jgi:hypothetical protein